MKGLPPSSGTGYGTLPDSIKNIFDAAYDFGKPLREVIEKVDEQCQETLKRLIGVGKWLLIMLIFSRIVYNLMFFAIIHTKGGVYFDSGTSRQN